MFLTPFTHSLESFGTDIDTLPIEETQLSQTNPDENMVTIDDELPDDDEVLDNIDEEIQGTESLMREIQHLHNLATAIETYGISPGMMLVADRDGLLASTFIGKIPATESMTGPHRPDSQTSVAALEGVMDAIKAKTAEWAAKAGGMVKSLAAKASEMIKSSIKWTVDFSKSVVTAPWDAAKAAGTIIKAHPYKTVAGVLASMAVAVTIFAKLVKMPSINDTLDEVAAWKQSVKTLLGKIKNITGLESLESSHMANEALSDNTSPETGTVSALGWTKNAVISTLSTLGSVLGKIGTALAAVVQGVIASIAHGVKSAIAGKIMRTTLRDAPKTGSRVANMAIGAIVFFVVKVTRLLINSVVRAGYGVINSTIKKVAKATLSR